MKLFATIPGLIWLLLFYLGVAYLGEGSKTLYSILLEVPLFSGTVMKISVNGLLVIIGLVLLFFECSNPPASAM